MNITKFRGHIKKKYIQISTELHPANILAMSRVVILKYIFRFSSNNYGK